MLNATYATRHKDLRINLRGGDESKAARTRIKRVSAAGRTRARAKCNTRIVSRHADVYWSPWIFESDNPHDFSKKCLYERRALGSKRYKRAMPDVRRPP